jgi:nucleotide-binding universal stress UspA family protein
MTQARADPHAEPGASHWSAPDRAVVVAVDGSERNHAAITWACVEAAASGRPLDLVHVLDERRVPGPFHAPETDDQHAWRLLEAVESELLESAPTVILRKEVAVGPVATTLVDRSATQAALVVGRRGFGSFVRLLIGSTSIDVASRARVPVIVVPDRWSVEEHQDEPVVVGVDPRQVQPDVLRFAFTEARLRQVPLVGAHGRDLPAGDGLSPSGGEVQTGPEANGLAEALEPYAQAFPDVAVSVVDLPGHPLSVLLDEVGPAQLLVLGRNGGGRREGFPFGSVAHAVLHYADIPVAIVPPSG